MSTIRCIWHGAPPDFPATDQHPDAVRYHIGNYYVDAIGGEPTQEEVAALLAPPVPEEISRYQFAHALYLLGDINFAEAKAFAAGELPSILQAAIDNIEDQQTRETADLLLTGRTAFRRHHPMTDFVRVVMNKTQQQTDAIWALGATL